MADTVSSFEAAKAAYHDYCDKADVAYEATSEEHSQVLNDVVFLRSGPTGYVARYSIRRGRLLH